MALDAPEAAAGYNLFVWGAAGRSVMPATPPDPGESLQVAAVELIASARAQRAYHPCDVSFGRDIVRVLAEAETQLATARSAPN
jgi:hypothetical protein